MISKKLFRHAILLAVALLGMGVGYVIGAQAAHGSFAKGFAACSG